MDWNVSGVEQTSVAANLSTTGSFPSGIFATALLDTRQYQSFYLTLQAQTLAAGTQYNCLDATVIWYADAAGSIVLARERYGIFAQSGGTFSTTGGLLIWQDQMHGPYMQISVGVPTGVATDTLSPVILEVVFTTRLVNAPYIREVSASNAGTLIRFTNENWVVAPAVAGAPAVGAGATLTMAGLMRPSAARWRVNSTVTFTLSVFTGDIGPTEIEQLTAAPAGIYNATMFMPHMPTLWSVRNTTAAPGAINLSVLSEQMRQ